MIEIFDLQGKQLT